MHLFVQHLLGIIFTLEDTGPNLHKLNLQAMAFSACEMAPKLINYQTD